MPATTTEQIIEALRPVEDPELHRSIVDLGMVRDVDIRRDGVVDVLIALTVAGCPLRNEITSRVHRRRWRRSTASTRVALDFTVMTDQEREDLRKMLHGDPGDTAGQAPGPRPRRGSQVPFAQPGSKTRPLLISSGKGGVGKSQRHRQPRGRARPAGPLGRRRRRRHLRLLDPAHARRRSRPGRDRRDARAAGGVGRALHLDRLLRPGGPGRDLARPDAAQGARAVPHRRVLGRARLPARSTCRRAPATSPSSLSQYLPRGEVLRRHHAAAGRPEGRRAVGGDGGQGQPAGARASSRTCRWFTGDDGKRYEIFGAGGGQELADELGVPLLGTAPAACPRCARAATTASRSPPSIPTARRRRRSTRSPGGSPSTCGRRRSSAPPSRSAERSDGDRSVPVRRWMRRWYVLARSALHGCPVDRPAVGAGRLYQRAPVRRFSPTPRASPAGSPPQKRLARNARTRGRIRQRYSSVLQSPSTEELNDLHSPASMEPSRFRPTRFLMLAPTRSTTGFHWEWSSTGSIPASTR